MTYIEEDDVSVGVSIITINSIESLRELNITELFPELWIHQKAHRFSNGSTVVDVMITIQVEHKWSICEHCRDSNLQTPPETVNWFFRYQKFQSF